MPGLDVEAFIRTVGYIGLFVMVFAETGLLVGFFLPGDTLLITAGLLAERGHFHVWTLVVLLIVAALVGDFVGYEIGKHVGQRLYLREDSRFFKRRHLERAQSFYGRHGGKTIVIARFLAIVRTFAPTIAGAAAMPYRKFAVYNFAGAALWVLALIWLGYFFGSRANNLELAFTLLVGVTVAVSIAPGLWHLWRHRGGSGGAQA